MTQTKSPPLFTPGQRLDAVVTIETAQGRKHHHRFGAAFVNHNGTIGVVLNSLPFERTFRLLPTHATVQGPPGSMGQPDDVPLPDAATHTDPADSQPSSIPASPRRRAPTRRDDP